MISKAFLVFPFTFFGRAYLLQKKSVGVQVEF